ncbi:hypothetical protein [Litoribacterium kuwaitense]|uniref:hypothetical protein n=1 Tax=Litoribacterium kuwaitense TaxID=1398745 RepID=UPI0035E41C97
MEMRHLREDDALPVWHAIQTWWGGRDLSHLVPRLFFQHFSNTSFIMEEDGATIGFLIGFFSQSKANEAYIHFVGLIRHNAVVASENSYMSISLGPSFRTSLW